MKYKKVKRNYQQKAPVDNNCVNNCHTPDQP